MDQSLEESWRIVSIGLADGVDEVDGRAVGPAFMHVLAAWVRGRIIDGPSSDASRCRLHRRFGMLRDVHTASDFISEILVERELQRQAGNLVDPAYRDLDREVGLAQIASTWWLRRRALTFVGQEAAAGMVGMPERNRDVASLDAGEDGGLGRGVADPRADVRPSPSEGDRSGDDGLDLLRRLADGRPVLVLDLEAVSSAATRSTAGVQTWPLLDPEGASHAQVREIVESAMSEPWAALESAHETARASHLARIETLRTRRFEHPNMTLRTVHELDRQIIDAESSRLFWPLIGSVLARLLGLPSVNAGEQRNTKYRKAIARLLPQIDGLPGAHPESGIADDETTESEA